MCCNRKITIHDSLEHIAVYGYFQHAFELYLEHIKPKDVLPIQVTEMRGVYKNIRSRLRNGTYLAPNILDALSVKSNYPFNVNFTDEELFWFKKIIKLRFDVVLRKTKLFYKKKKEQLPEKFYSELYNNLRTDKAIEYLINEFVQKNQLSKKSSSSL